MKKIILIGSTGSVGLNALEIARAHPARFKIAALCADSSHETLLSQIREFSPQAVCLANKDAAARLRPNLPPGTRLLQGPQGVREITSSVEADLVIAASSGSSALLPVLDAIRGGKSVAIANKEILVMAGRILAEEAAKAGNPLLPVDSEHNAIFQCLRREDHKSIRKIWLTGSGGPLRNTPLGEFKGMSREVVLNHPKWVMGPKITVDSATMMNKGLEIIEARWLFGVSPGRIRLTVHPEAIVHSMVEFNDGSLIAHLGPTDMKLPLIHVMGYPERVKHPALGLGFGDIARLNFEEPDTDKFACLKLAIEVSRRGDATDSAVLNAADEVAVRGFLSGEIDFTDIPRIIEKALENHRSTLHPDLDEILAADAWAREESNRLITRITQQVKA